MPSEKTFRKLRVFVACPKDVAEEKERLSKVISSLQFDAAGHGFVLEFAEWQQCIPSVGDPQNIIFDQLKPESWDIFIGILWTRFGTGCGIRDPKTNREFTGTEVEILRAIEINRAHGRPRVLIYRSTRAPKSLKDLQGAQLEAIDDFLKDCEANGKHPALVRLYEQPDDFERLVNEHLRKTFATVDLEELKSVQKQQQDHLSIMQLVLPLLLPKEEQQHLLNLGLEKTPDYQGHRSLRSELRRLRTMGLIEKHPYRNIADIKDNLTVDLSKFVYLTKAGKEWVKIIRHNDETLARGQSQDGD